MKKENRAYIENNKKQEYAINKTSKFFSFTSILKLTLALALFLMAALFINAGNVIVENGALNVSNNLLVDTNTLFADSANNRVGIGTTAPSNLLTLKSNSGQLRLETSSDPNSYNTILHSPYNSNHPFNLSVTNGGALAEYLGVYADGGTNNRVVFPTGNVGIGTTSPTAALDVRSAVSIGANAATTGSLRLPAEGYIYARNAANTANIFMVGLSADDVYLGHINPNIYFRTADGSTRMTIDSTGNVGISDTTPDRDLDIGSSSINSGDSGWTVESDSAFKDNIAEKAPDVAILDKWLNTKIYEWTYKESHLVESMGLEQPDNETEALSKVMHTGLMADEFNPLFMENDNTELNYGDVQLKMIEAIKALIAENNALKARVEALESG